MRKYECYTELVTSEREPRANYHTLVSCVLPRPIAWVSTLSADGVANLAPFSFFNGVCADPPAVLFCPAVNVKGQEKDTLRNLRATGQCVINVVNHEARQAMNRTSYAYPPEVSELEKAALSPLASRLVKPARVAESPVQMECKLIEIVKVGSGPLSGNICVCEILIFHIAEELCLPDGTADIARIDLVGRLGGDGYSTVRDRFDLPKPVAPS